MTYRKLFQLKFRDRLSTLDLQRKFPENLKQINEIAMLDVPEGLWKEVVREEAALMRLMRLKRKFAKFISSYIPN